jgi:pre-rRNA-processing protein TSR3
MLYEVLMDSRENPRKCTIHPLRGRADFKIRYFKRNAPIAPFSAEVLLHMDGDNLADLPKGAKIHSLAVIDCTWKKVAPALSRVQQPLPRLVRIPDGFLTAYPRRNLEGKDPDGGLATIEALFIAAAFCGNWDETLLEHYHFGKDFIRINEALWKKYELGPYK